MKKFFTIFRAEYAQVVKRKSFIIGIFLTPLIMIAMTLLPAFLATRDVPGKSSYAVIDLDGRGIGEKLASEMAVYKLEDDSTAEAFPLYQIYAVDPADSAGLDSLSHHLDSLVQNKIINRYIIIFPDVDQKDSVLMVAKSASFKSIGRFDYSLSQILTKMRLEHSQVDVPVDSLMKMTRRVSMTQQSPGGKSREFLSIYFGALIFVLIIFASVIGFGQVLMRSVIEEKSSRIMEVLISSVSPFQLMMGKIIGLGAANLTQVAVWAAIGFLLFGIRTAVNIPPEVGDIIFNPILMIFFVVFLILAYMMYSTAFAFIGSIVSSDKEAQNFVLPITFSLMLPIFLLMNIVQQPDSTMTTVLSFIPVFTPTMMMARLNIVGPESFSDPVVLEAFAGVAICALFVIVIIWVTARVFRLGILMYGKRATLPEIVKWVRHK